ncbi:MAG TPA: NUDIX hydrolase [Candidatus Paceibacterota bacterium]|nr:NUDIX hydrolase [Verrucomicrobiota bacterium]HSA12071.1 NUDIX hydrolase [Candidatus Paceibacterota bacterium]
MVPTKDHQLKPWQVLDSREVFQAPPYIRVIRQRVRVSDGRVVDDYHQVQMTDFVLVVASTADGHILMERQYKHGIGDVTLVVPAGTISPGEDPLAAAQRELLEETGYAAEDWRRIGSFVAHANYGCSKAYVFAARKARAVAAPKSGDLEEMEILLLRPEEIYAAIRAGQVKALSAAAAITLATHPDLARCG